jgi:hypothetical protein
VLRIGRETEQPDAQEMYEEPLPLIRWQQGRLAEVLPELRTAPTRLPGVSSRWAALACAEAICGNAAVARATVGEAAHAGFPIFYGPPWLGCMCQWADAASDVGDTHAASLIYPKLLPWRHLFATAGPLPIRAVSIALGRLAALLGDHEAAAGTTARR